MRIKMFECRNFNDNNRKSVSWYKRACIMHVFLLMYCACYFLSMSGSIPPKNVNTFQLLKIYKYKTIFGINNRNEA